MSVSKGISMFAEDIKQDLYSCLKCAMCQPVCPTWKVTRMERHAPRGRIQMIRKYLEGDLTITKSLKEALMSCILCEACAKACPSGVRTDRLFENMRMDLYETLGPGLAKKALMTALSNPMLMRLGAKVGRVGQRVILSPLNVGAKLGNIPINRLPSFNRSPFRKRVGELVPAKGKRVGRLVYFTGCATDLINEQVGDAVVNVLTNLGYEVVIPQDQVCCAVPVFLAGARREALPNIEKNLAVLDREDADAIVVDCATCGGGLKKAIPHLVEDLGVESSALNLEKAKRVAGKVKDVSEIVADRLNDLELESSHRQAPVRVTYHDSCHMLRSMGVSKEPRALIQSLDDVELVEMAGSDQCCGGAGSFQFEHVEMSAGVTGRKKENIRNTNADMVVTGCPGCNLTLGGNLYEPDDPEVAHFITLVSKRLRKS